MKIIILFTLALLCFTNFQAITIHEAVILGKTAQVDSLLKADPALLDQQNNLGETPLFLAAKDGNIAILKVLLQKKANTEIPNNDGFYPYHIAAWKGKLEVVKILLSYSVDPNQLCNKYSSTALAWAADGGHLDVVKYLRESKDMDVNTEDRLEWTPIIRAASRGHGDVFEYLLAKGATLEDPQDPSCGTLFIAASGGNTQIVQRLLERGYDVNMTNNTWNTTALISALWAEKVEMVRFLIEHGAKTYGVHNQWGYEPILLVALKGNVEIAKLLLDNGADVKTQLAENRTQPIHYAALRGYLPLTELFLQRGADINALNNTKETPLSLAISADHIELAKFLIDKGASLKMRSCPVEWGCSTNSTSAVHMAAAFNADILSYILEKGGNPNMENNLGETPIFNTVWQDSLSSFDVLMQKSIDVNHQNIQGQTILHKAVYSSKQIYMKKLLKAGANPNTIDNQGMTPLHIACQKGFVKPAELLIESGAKKDIKDIYGKTPLDYAIHNGNQLIVEKISKKHQAKSAADVLNAQMEAKTVKIWYLGHSGWAFKTRNHLVIVDYYESGAQADQLSILNGSINPAELKDQNVVVIASHGHSDHFIPGIFEWRKSNPNIKYVMGFKPEEDNQYHDILQPVPEYTYLAPDSILTIDGVVIRSFRSNDAGIGFTVSFDGINLFHPGDTVNKSQTVPNEYTRIIDKIALRNEKFDFAFFPVAGCGFSDLTALKQGAYYAIEKLYPKYVFPMHMSDAEYKYREFAQQAKIDKINTPFVTVDYKGASYLYSKGEIREF